MADGALDLLDVVRPNIASLSVLLTDEARTTKEKQETATRACLRAASSGDSDLLEFLLKNKTVSAGIDLSAVDEDGATALVLATCFGHGECVRLLIEAGADPSTSKDRAGWTALHWAAQNSDVPLASYLLNHRAPTDIRSYKGLLPMDLAKRSGEGEILRDILSAAHESRSETDINLTIKKKDKRKKEETRAKRKLELAVQTASTLQFDISVLDIQAKSPVFAPDSSTSETSTGAFDWDVIQPDQMLVLNLDHLPKFLDLVIRQQKPIRTLNERILPANAIFLAARFAVSCESQDLLEEVLLGTVETIEDTIQADPDDMTRCAFWLANSVLIYYYLYRDPNLFKMSLGFRHPFRELVNELYVYVVRDAEQRIERILDTAMLDYEALPGFESVRFEGEWRIVKALTGTRGKKDSISTRSSVISFFSSSPQAVDHSQAPNLQKKQSLTNIRSPGLPSAENITPRSIAAILSSTLLILQLFEIHPSIICQAFSQIFYWIACELTNRILTRKRYLCRSKAVQIRLNASSLEDWARVNRLPPKVISRHFRPLNQLLQWLQCLSSEDRIDSLVGTMQNLSALNPLQLRKAAQEYRYEVDEPKFGDECVQYLAQTEKDWNRRRAVKNSEQSAQFRSSSSELGSSNGSTEIDQADLAQRQQAQQEVDKCFADPSLYAQFEPAAGPECLGEMLDSRFMLPFALPPPETLLTFGQRHPFGPSDLDSPVTSVKQHTPNIFPSLPESFLQSLDEARSSLANFKSPTILRPHTPEVNVVSGLGVHINGASSLDHWEGWRSRLSAELKEEEESEIRREFDQPVT